MAMKRILTTSQREQLLSVDHLSEEDFKAYFSFSDYDLEVINQHRGKVNKRHCCKVSDEAAFC
ncbi:TPA: DUF4158 domain-containing protein, partial [Escherichia coli]